MAIAAQQRLSLPHVTLIAVSSVNLLATIGALKASMAQVDFGAAKLLSDCPPAWLPDGAEWVSISRLTSAATYSEFILGKLVDHITTSHALVVQWDGHVLDAKKWQSEFMEYDFIGASWPQFSDGHDVGNGGFSLRSRALLEACRATGFRPSHPEDLAIGRHNRSWLEAQGLRIAPRDLADAFSAERAGDPTKSFGYHGVWHMPKVLGSDDFWKIYAELDDRTTLRHDFASVLWQVACGKAGAGRAFSMIRDRFRTSAARKRIEL